MPDPLNAFCEHSDVRLEGVAAGPLQGLTFAAKDLFDIEGYVTGAGNPDWLATHAPATATAPVVRTLVDAGAAMVGKTHTDELSRGALGMNRHYGTPINPLVPDRIPGGSSSGSAAAVAGGLVDFALGTDTGGSVRIPGSFCGIFGIRPTHDRLSLQGVVGQSPSFDTVGWFARDIRTFAKVGAVLLEEKIEDWQPKRIVIAKDTFEFANLDVSETLEPVLERLVQSTDRATYTTLADVGLEIWQRNQAVVQRKEAWQTFRDWIDSSNPRFGFDVATVFAMGASTSDTAFEDARGAVAAIRAEIEAVLADQSVICVPTTPCIAPDRGIGLSERRIVSQQLLTLTSIAGLAGAPQVTIPVAKVHGAPVGLSFIGARGSDAELIGFVREIVSKISDD